MLHLYQQCVVVTEMIVRLLIDARFAGSRLAGQRSVAGWVGEAMGGLSYLEFIRTLAKRVEEDWQGVQVRCHGGGRWRTMAAALPT